MSLTLCLRSHAGSALSLYILLWVVALTLHILVISLWFISSTNHQCIYCCIVNFSFLVLLKIYFGLE